MTGAGKEAGKEPGEAGTSPFRPVADGLLCAVRLTPRAKRPGCQGVSEGADGRPRLLVAVSAPPVEGAANAALIELLAGAWRVPKSTLDIRSGATGREKILHIAGDAQTLRPRLEAWLAEEAASGGGRRRAKGRRGGPDRAN